MLKNTPSWTTTDGKIHTIYMAALRHELMLWLSKAADNDVVARKIVESITEESIGGFVDLLEEVENEYTHPSQFSMFKATQINSGPRFITDSIFEEVPVEVPSASPPVVQPLLTIVPTDNKTTVTKEPVDISKFG